MIKIIYSFFKLVSEKTLTKRILLLILGKVFIFAFLYCLKVYLGYKLDLYCVIGMAFIGLFLNSFLLSTLEEFYPAEPTKLNSEKANFRPMLNMAIALALILVLVLALVLVLIIGIQENIIQMMLVAPNVIQAKKAKNDPQIIYKFKNHDKLNNFFYLSRVL